MPLCVETHRSTTGLAFLLHGGKVSRESKIQSTVMEAEYVAVSDRGKVVLWLHQLLSDMRYMMVPMKAHCDS